jgi:hypothetical protein
MPERQRPELASRHMIVHCTPLTRLRDTRRSTRQLHPAQVNTLTIAGWPSFDR